MTDKTSIFIELLGNKDPAQLRRIWDDLDVFNWPDNERRPLITADAVIDILKRYISGSLSAAQVEKWAGMLEASGDEFTAPNDETLRQTLHVLANPEMEQSPLSPERAQYLLRLLSR